QNNIFMGGPDFTSPGDTTCYFWFDRDNFYQTQMDYNVIYNAKMGNNSYAAHDLNQDPLLVNDGLTSFDGHLLSGSPAKDSGLAVGSLNGLVPSNDIEGSARPGGAGVDRGAYEYGGVSPQGQIALSRTKLYFGAAGSTTVTPSQTFFISNSGSGTLSWDAAPGASWLNCSPASGMGSAEITVSVDTSGLAAGTYSSTIAVTSADASNSPQSTAVTLTVYAANGSAAPFGRFSTPEEGAQVSSSIPVTGWVLDDIGVESVKIYRDEGGSPVYIGDALFVEGARPDVEQAYPDYPMNYKAGWGYMMLTNFLPNGGNGTFTLHAIATDREGHQVTLGTRTITCDNAGAVKPFGAIDTPEPGGDASGTGFRNSGWVLTPTPNRIPEDGSTIDVYVDGMNLGHPVYNIYRSDIASLFPGYTNSSGAHAYFNLDTTAYDNGVHTIAWYAEDDAGNGDGIGSRYFTINNVNTGNPRRGTYKGEQGLGIRKQVTGNRRGGPVWPPERSKTKIIGIKECERLVLPLPPNTRDGYLKVGGQLRRLPTGSTLDAEKGIFYWQPGPGFVGRYHLRFIGPGETAIDITVDIVPRTNHGAEEPLIFN
ncbi:MAG: BACON domain-containing protein, partial [bacterium]|nr:BACON domain-containing protein [bacterium]